MSVSDGVLMGLRAGRRRPARERGYWGQAWHDLRHDPTAMLGLALVLLVVLAALLAPLIAPHDPNVQNRLGLSLDGQPLGPSAEFKLGTDPSGRDELSRLLYGARVSLLVGVGANLIAAVIGLLLGGLSGMARGAWQSIGMRVVDVILSFPILLLAIMLLAVSRPTTTSITLVIGIGFGGYLSRIVFAQVVSLREREFVLAARASGLPTPSILLRHVVPHVLPSVLIFSALGVGTAIQLEAALSYVGLGIQPPTATWGNMISEGQSFIASAPQLVLLPGAAIVVAMAGFSLLGDGLRDALDPTLERRTRLLGTGGVR